MIQWTVWLHLTQRNIPCKTRVILAKTFDDGFQFCLFVVAPPSISEDKVDFSSRMRPEDDCWFSPCSTKLSTMFWGICEFVNCIVFDSESTQENGDSSNQQTWGDLDHVLSYTFNFWLTITSQGFGMADDGMLRLGCISLRIRLNLAKAASLPTA